MDLVLYGLNHMTAPLEVRERLSFKVEDSSGIMSRLCSMGVFSENLLLSTCNRTEVYGIAEQASESITKLQEFLADSGRCGTETLREYSYLHLNVKAVQHLFRVSAGLDSLVVGEVEILRQIKDAYRAATGVDATGPYLNKLFHHCFRVGKRVRNETAISAGGISVGSSAVELAKKVLGKLDGRRALLIGAGETGQLVARHLIYAGISELAVTNRTVSKAEQLSREYGGSAIPFDEYPAHLSRFDLIITAVGAPQYIIRREMLKRSRGLYPLLIDLGVPRDIDPEIDKSSGAIVYHIDDLQGIVNEQLAKREKEVPKAEHIVAEETARFISWSDSLRAQRTITDLRDKFNELKEEILDSWKGRLSPAEFKKAERITDDLVNKLLHDPTVSLKGCELAAGDKRCETCDMYREGSGCIHGHLNQEIKCIIIRMLFGIQDPSAFTELKMWDGSFSAGEKWDNADGEKHD